MYIKMGIKRMPIEKQSDLVSLIIPGISQLGDTHASSLFNILLTVLPNLKLPERGTEESDKLKSVLALIVAQTMLLILRKNLPNYFC